MDICGMCEIGRFPVVLVFWGELRQTWWYDMDVVCESLDRAGFPTKVSVDEELDSGWAVCGVCSVVTACTGWAPTKFGCGCELSE